MNFSAPELALHVINELRYRPRPNFPLHVGYLQGKVNAIQELR